MNEAERKVVRETTPEIDDVFVVDLSDAVRARSAFAEILAGYDALQAAICCAGFANFGPIETSPLTALRAIMEVNTYASVAVYQAALPYLRICKGRMIAVSSYAGKLGFPLFGHYSASKHALEGLMNVARLEASQWGVPVSLIVPGGVKTAMTSDLSGKLAAGFAQLTSENAAQYKAYFDQYKSLMNSIYESFIDPERVADAIVTAVESVEPEIRYVVGDDAVALFAQKHNLTDRDFDNYLRSIFPGNPA